MTKRRIAVVGGGLVGSLMAIFLTKRGYDAHVFERRADFRTAAQQEGRSINLALSNRGLRALRLAGLEDKVLSIAIQMHGRMVHDAQGNLSLLPYGTKGQYINSISRHALNVMLIEAAEQHGVNYHFNKRCYQIDLDRNELGLIDGQIPFNKLPNPGDISYQKFDGIIGADGAFSAVRSAFLYTDRFDFSQDYIEHGYKELTIPSTSARKVDMEMNALHIWPRESFMMIALPNTDGSFTCTLFFPFEGNPSFSSIRNDQELTDFFKHTFPDAVDLIPDLCADFKTNPTGSLVTMKCFPWTIRNTVLIGDAAHAVVPFYGQGMNAGFEDCRVLDELLDTHHNNWSEAIAAFQVERKRNADAISALALNNFIEMRDLVADPDFLLQKKIEAKLHELFPEQWIPLYSMVTFHDEIEYAEAMEIGKRQQRIMNEVLKYNDIETTWRSLNFQQIVQQLQDR